MREIKAGKFSEILDCRSIVCFRGINESVFWKRTKVNEFPINIYACDPLPSTIISPYTFVARIRTLASGILHILDSSCQPQVGLLAIQSIAVSMVDFLFRIIDVKNESMQVLIPALPFLSERPNCIDGFEASILPVLSSSSPFERRTSLEIGGIH